MSTETMILLRRPTVGKPQTYRIHPMEVERLPTAERCATERPLEPHAWWMMTKDVAGRALVTGAAAIANCVDDAQRLIDELMRVPRV